MPLILTQVYLTLTVLLYAFGPWSWPMRNPGSLYVFLIAVQLALIVGYLSVAHKRPAETTRGRDPKKLILICLIAMGVLMPFLPYARTGHWIPSVGSAISNPGQAYQESLEFRKQGVNAAALLTVALGPLLMALFPLVVFYWKRLSILTRISSTLLLLGMMFLSVATGQRRDIADQLITLPFILIASHWAGITRISRRTIMTLSTGFALFCVVFTVYFCYSNASRVGNYVAAGGFNPVTKEGPNWDHALLADTPQELRPGVLALANYLTTGYYGCSLAMDRDWQPMYGIGNSMFLTYVGSRLTNNDALLDRSYPVRIDHSDGFTYPVHWCTAYPYLANDLSFPGVVILMLFVGRLFASVWIDACGGRNPYAVVLLALTLVLVIYLPATNRMLQDGDGITAFYGWLAVWWGYRRSRKPAPSPAGAAA